MLSTHRWPSSSLKGEYNMKYVLVVAVILALLFPESVGHVVAQGVNAFYESLHVHK